jgi:DNA-binding transcriptional ArsR family regulator
MSPALIQALDHPLRREVLRLLGEQGTESSPTELTKSISASLTDLSYHVRALADLLVIGKSRTEEVRGYTKHFYVSKVVDNKLVSAILASTRDDDKKIRRSRK